MNGPKTLVVFVARAMEPRTAMSEAGADEAGSEYQRCRLEGWPKREFSEVPRQ